MTGGDGCAWGKKVERKKRSQSGEEAPMDGRCKLGEKGGSAVYNTPISCLSFRPIVTRLVSSHLVLPLTVVLVA